MKSESLRVWLRMAAVFISLVGHFASAAGEDAGSSETPPPREMRILTVGEMPPFRQEIRDGVRYQLPAAPGSLPPVELEVTVPGADDREEKLGSMRLRLGNLGAPLTIPGGGGAVMLRRPDGDGGTPPWLRIERPESGDFIVILWRGAKENSWDSPAALALSSELPAGAVSLVNVAPGPVAVVFDKERIALPPGRPVARALAPGKPLGLQVGLPRGNGLQRLVSRSVEQMDGQHSLVVFYRADGEKPRSPLGIEVIRLRAD